MREWHLEHVNKTVLKYVEGLSATATSWEKRNHRKYGGLTSVCRQIEYDMKHGVTKEEVMASFSRMRTHPSFLHLRGDDPAKVRLSEIEAVFTAPKPNPQRWY